LWGWYELQANDSAAGRNIVGCEKVEVDSPPSELWVMEEGATPLIVEVALFTHAE
jgi:hypothetical protein